VAALSRAIELIRSTVALVRRRPFDQATPEGRSRERYRRVALATLTAGTSRVLATIGLLVAVPLVSHRLGDEQLGLWVLLVSAVALLGFADLGIGNGLLNILSDAHGHDDAEGAVDAVSSAFLALVALAGVLGVSFALLYPHVPWASLLNATGSAEAVAGPAVAVFTASVLLSMPFGIGQRIHLAYQEGWRASAWSAGGSLASLVGVVVASIMHTGLVGFLVAMLGGLPLAYLLESTVVFVHERPDLRPRLARATSHAAKRVLRTGFLFFTLAMAIAVAYQSDSLVIAHYLGAAAVTTYALPLRLFLLAPTAVTLLVTPLWPAYGEALARRDIEWVRTTLRRSLGAALALTIVPSVVLVLVARPLLHLWVGNSIDPPWSMLIAMGLWAVVSSISNALAMFFNGANAIRFQVIIAATMATANLALSIVLVRSIGIAGPMWGSVATQSLLVLVPELIVIRRVLRHPHGGALPAFLHPHFSEPEVRHD
jgi:O-antigen/teichoic acid export membrane protein